MVNWNWKNNFKNTYNHIAVKSEKSAILRESSHYLRILKRLKSKFYEIFSNGATPKAAMEFKKKCQKMLIFSFWM